MTSLLLHRAGVPTPPAWVLRDPALARSRWLAEANAGHSLVVKPLFGSQGEGLVRLQPGEALPDSQCLGGVYYLQRYVEPAHGYTRDWRVFVVGGRAIAAMAREADCWVNNVARGARCRPAVLDRSLSELAERAVEALGLDYGGVDIMDDASGNPLVIEVNSIPAWQGLQSVSSADIATRLAEDFLRYCYSGRRREATLR
jgi:RimK family alpha-L-glutamate ligase